MKTNGMTKNKDGEMKQKKERLNIKKWRIK